jgi:hypothetical protein
MQLTQAMVAEHLDMSQPKASKLLAGLGLDLSAGLDAVRVAYIRQLRSAAAGRDGPDLAGERLMLTAARRRMAEVDLRTRCGELVEADEIRRALVGIAAGLRTTLERLPDVLGPRLAVESDEHAVTALLTVEIDGALDAFATALRAGQFARESAGVAVEHFAAGHAGEITAYLPAPPGNDETPSDPFGETP